MSDYYIADPSIGAIAYGVDRTAATSLGGGAGEFVYCRGSNAASIGAFVQIQNGSAVALAAANSASNFPIGVACAVLSATSQYGWVQIQGRVDYAQGTNTSAAAGVPRYICAGTAGIVVSNVVAGNRIQGLVVPYDQSGTKGTDGTCVFDLYRPFVAGLTASL